MPPRPQQGSRGAAWVGFAIVAVCCVFIVLSGYTLVKLNHDIHARLAEEHALHEDVEGALQHPQHARRKVIDAVLQQHADTMNFIQEEGEDSCHIDPNNEYHGDVVTWGIGHSKASAEECCAACKAKAGCNIWVWCGRVEGCGYGDNVRPYQECWHKKNTIDYVMENKGKGNPGIHWTAGALYSVAELAEWRRRDVSRRAAEAARLAALRDNQDLPLVWVEVSLRGKLLGRIEMVLYVQDAPRAAENMRQMCGGEKSAGASLQMAYFYRIIDRFIDQTGAATDGIYSGWFLDDLGGLRLKHTHKGLLSMANSGPNTNGGHFSFIMGPAHHLDGSYTIFGEVVSGFEVLDAVNALAQGQPNNELLNSKDAQITATGQIRRGAYVDTPAYQAVIASEYARVKYQNQLDYATRRRLSTLRDNKELPLVYFEVAIKGVYAGRIEMVLFAKDSPLATESFRALCTGEAGVAQEGRRGAGKPVHYQGMYFYRIVHNFIDQAGPETDSPFGGEFSDDAGGLALVHDRKGLLSAAHHGANTNNGHFSIMMGPAPHLNGKYTIFGEVVDGLHVVEAINALAAPGRDHMHTQDAQVVESGELRRGSYALSKPYTDGVEAEKARIRATRS